MLHQAASLFKVQLLSHPLFQVHDVFQLLVEHIGQLIRDRGRVFPINKPLIQTQPVQQDPPLFAYCIFIFIINFTQSAVVER